MLSPMLKSLFFLFITLNFAALSASEEEALRWYEEIESQAPISRDALTFEERRRLLRLVSNHKVASLDALDKYDTTGEVGFCFGRAMTAHLIARKMGLEGEGIRKLFVIGDLRSGPNPEWRFHVTTLVKGKEDGKWHAIDPIMLPPIAPGTSIAAQQWIDVVQRVWDKNKAAHFYLAERNTIMPDMRIFPVTKEDEKGTSAVELTFDPIGKPGFDPFVFDTTRAFALDLIAQEEHFMRVPEPKAGESFPFLGMSMTVINKGKTTHVQYDFNGYFTDLLSDLRLNELEASTGWEEMAPRAMVAPERSLRPNLHSMRIRGLR